MLVYGILVIVLSLFFFVMYLLIAKPNLAYQSQKNQANIQGGLHQIIQKLDDIHIKGGYKKLLAAYTVFLLTTVVALFLLQVNVVISLAMMTALCYLPFFVLNTIKKRRLQLFERQLPDAIDLMAGSLKSGNSLVGAFALIAEEFPSPLADEIGLVVREQKLGVSVDESLQNFATRMPHNSVVLTVSTIRTSIQTGGELSDALNNIAQTLRSIEQAEGKIKALTAQGKMQAWVVGLMPVILMLVLTKMEPVAMSQLWSTQIGHIALGVIIILEVLGVVFIRKIVNIDV